MSAEPINVSFLFDSIQVWPERNGRNHVVGCVKWIVVLERNGASVNCMVETLLDIDGLENFIDIENVTENQCIAWALNKEGGDQFISRMQTQHLFMLEYRERQLGLVPWTLNG